MALEHCLSTLQIDRFQGKQKNFYFRGMTEYLEVPTNVHRALICINPQFGYRMDKVSPSG